MVRWSSCNLRKVGPWCDSRSRLAAKKIMNEIITVLLVDDHSLVRRGFRRILEDESDIAVAGEAGDATQAIRLAGELQPRVAVLDITLPGMSGLQAIPQITAASPETRILILSMHSEDNLVRQA